MALPRFKTQYEYEFNPETDAESNDGTIHSVPDLSFSMQEILERFTMGLPIDDQRRPVRYDDEEWDDEDFDVHPSLELEHDLTDLDEAARFVDDVRRRTPRSDGESESETRE